MATYCIFPQPKVLTYHVTATFCFHCRNNLSCVNINHIQVFIQDTCSEFRWSCICYTSDLCRQDIWNNILLSYNQWSQVSWICFVSFNNNSTIKCTGCNENSLINILWSFFNHNSIRLKSSITFAWSSKVTHYSSSCLSVIFQTDLWWNLCFANIINNFYT